MKIYIIGPVTGHEDNNVYKFRDLRERVRGMFPNAEIAIPHDSVPPNATWQEAMRRSMERMLDADLVVAMDGWCDSKGASLEQYIASQVGIDVLFEYQIR